MGLEDYGYLQAEAVCLFPISHRRHVIVEIHYRSDLCLPDLIMAPLALDGEKSQRRHLYYFPLKTRRWPYSGLMLGQRRKIVFAGSPLLVGIGCCGYVNCRSSRVRLQLWGVFIIEIEIICLYSNIIRFFSLSSVGFTGWNIT